MSQATPKTFPAPLGHRIRLADKRDMAALREVFDHAFSPVAGALGYRPSPMDRSFFAAVEAQLVFAVEASEDAPAVGFLTSEIAASHLYISALAVLPDMQGRGLGRALLSAAESLAGDLCLPRVRLDTDPNLSGQTTFYRACGYRELRRFSAGDGVRVRFTKPVTTALERLLGAPTRN